LKKYFTLPKQLFILSGILLISGCSGKKTTAARNTDNIIERLKCFSVNSRMYYGDISGNVAIQTTPQGNFLKCTAISDTEFVFSCGRGSLEYHLDTFKCSESYNLPEVKYESGALLVLFINQGSYVWENKIMRVDTPKPIISTRIYYIDSLFYRYADIEGDTDKVYFNVHDMFSGENHLVRSNYYKFCSTPLPYDNISNVFLKGGSLYYSVNCGGKEYKDSLDIN